MQLDEKTFVGDFSYYRDGSRNNAVSYLYAHDLNGDGVDEVLFASFETQPNTPAQYSNTSVHIYGWQAGIFKEVTQTWLPGDSNLVEGVGDVTFGDFNGDGRQDVFLSAYTDMKHPVNAYVLYNTGSGFNKVSMGLQTWQHSVRSFDINKDGFDDVIPVGYADMPRYIGSATGLVKFKGFTGGSGLALGDFLNNGKASVIFVDAGQGLNDTYLYQFDFSAPGYVSALQFSQLPGPRLESVAPTSGSHDIRAVPVDFNDDGLLDVLIIGYGFGLSNTATHRSEVQFLLNKGQGVFVDVTTTYLIGFDINGYVGYTPQLIDINQDGRLDLFLSMPDWLPQYNSTTLLLQQQDHTFVDSARILLKNTVASGGGQGVVAQGPGNEIYLITEGAWNRGTALTSVYLQQVSFPEREASETLSGTRYDDKLFGLGGDDALQGNAGNDTLIGGLGNDSLSGGEGTDRAIFTGALSDYTVVYNTNSHGFTITDKVSGRDGTDVVSSTESFQFSDGIRDATLWSDTTAPTVSTFSPTDGNTGVAVGNNIVLTFSEAIVKGTGNILIRSVSATGVIFETFNSASSSRLTFSDNSLTIDPTKNLAGNTKYFVTFAAGTVKDAAGNRYRGISTYDFTTVAVPITGTAGNDSLTGTTGIDTIYGLAGNDVLSGLAGLDVMNGGEGSDIYLMALSTAHPGAEINDSGLSGMDEVRYSATSGILTLYAEDLGIETVVLGTGTGATAVVTGSSGVSVNASAVTNALTLTGNNGINTITGTNHADTLIGNGGNDILLSGLGNDVLRGGLGKDKLTGGAGLDTFRLDTAPNASTNLDTIADFNLADDTIELENSIFTALLATGALNAASFRSGAGVTTAADANDYLIYNTTTGALYYDANGSTPGAAVQIATFTTKPFLTASDFWII